jgi:exodeoxyribonuclease V
MQGRKNPPVSRRVDLNFSFRRGGSRRPLNSRLCSARKAVRASPSGGRDKCQTAISQPRSTGLHSSAQALDAIGEWCERGNSQTFFLSGFAGTGKTTLAREVSRRVGGKMIFCSVTGRACAVLVRKGCPGPDTIDHLIYARQRVEFCSAKPPCDIVCPDRCEHKRERFQDKVLDPDSPVAKADLIVADEVSMLGRAMAEDLLSFGTPVLVLGDIGQLPAIGDAGYFTTRTPDFHMSQIHRQAQGSPIIRLAARAWYGVPLAIRSSHDSAVVRDIDDEELTGFDQIIVGTHRKRHAVNTRVRKHLGFAGAFPRPGEKLVALKNDRFRGLRNGELDHVVEAEPDGGGFVEMIVAGEDGLNIDVVAPLAGFHGDGNGADLPEQPFDYGYAITCHKAQGSEFDAVLVFDESAVFREASRKWLYTAITRAAERVTVVLL